MACGTPVIGFRRRSVPEIIEEGRSGFIVDTVNEAVAAIARIATLSRTMSGSSAIGADLDRAARRPSHAEWAPARALSERRSDRIASKRSRSGSRQLS
jgi:glycosyltransferase involved in cell wall biosynthesis